MLLMYTITLVLCSICFEVISSTSVTINDKGQNAVSPSLCNNIKFLQENRRNKVRESLLKSVCQAGLQHVNLDSQLKQFAAFLIHRDDFDPIPKWHSGDAQDVMRDPSFVVNDVVMLKMSKYHWYKHGYPFWPMEHQALPGPVTSPLTSAIRLLTHKKDVDWPNYGFATPVYYAWNAWRDPNMAMEEFFQDETQKNQMHKKNKVNQASNLRDLEKLKSSLKPLLNAIEPSNVESYKSWPFLRLALKPMIKSAFVRSKNICPDELILYFRINPCHPSEPAALACDRPGLDALALLTEAGCRTTNVIIGYSEDYSGNVKPM